MNNILILNLGSSQDILMSSHLISSYREEYPNSQVSILTYEANAQLAALLSGVSNIYTIDADLMKTIISNPLYSDGFAVNHFSSSLAPLMETKWHKVINYSNDKVSSYLTQAIPTDQVIGSYINKNGVAQTTDQWSTYLNNVASGMSRSTISIPEIKNHMAMTPTYSEKEKIKIDPEYLFVANQNFTRIRQMNGANAKYIVGINLEVGYDGSSLSEETVAQVIEAVNDNEDYKAVLLTSGKGYQKKIVNNLNKSFNDSLISINVETGALSSVVTNLDTLISAANDQMIIADALEINTIEVRDNANQVTTATSMNEGNYIIYNHSNNDVSSDIILALNERYETHMPISAMNSVNPTFISIKDDFGVYFTQVRGELNIQAEINYHIGRAVHFETLGYPQNTELLNHIRNNTQESDLNDYSHQVKSELTNTVKILLATLRALKGATSSQSSLNNFINYLDQLMKMGSNDTIVGSLVRFFEGTVENINSKNAEDNMKEIETQLFGLKSNLQIVSNSISTLLNEVEEVVNTTEAREQNI